MYAIVETGGRQYKVQPGQTILVNKVDAEPGSTVELDRVLLVSTEAGLTVGRPTVAGARVLAEVVGQEKGEKVVVFKYKAKTRYRRKTGHRQPLTRLLVREFEGVK